MVTFTETSDVADAARSYLASGLCVLAADVRGKRPAVGGWKTFERRLPTAGEIEGWFSAGHADAMCIVAGAIKPFIATAYIPGQEEANLEFIRRHSLGWVVLEPQQQRELVATLASSPAELNIMKATVEAYRQWNSAANEQIVPIIQSLVAAIDIQSTVV